MEPAPAGDYDGEPGTAYQLMENPKGKILSLVDGVDGVRAVVSVDVAASCPRCAAGKGCGAGLFSSSDSLRQVEASVPPGVDVSVDDVVEVTLAPNNLLQASVLVYGLPLLGAILAAAIAYALTLGDAAAATAAIAGLGLGLIAGRWRLRQTSCLRRFIPSVEPPG